MKKEDEKKYLYKIMSLSNSTNILVLKFTIHSKSDASHQCSPAWIPEPMQSLLGYPGLGYRSRSYNCFDIILLSHRVHNNVPIY